MKQALVATFNEYNFHEICRWAICNHVEFFTILHSLQFKWLYSISHLLMDFSGCFQ